MSERPATLSFSTSVEPTSSARPTSETGGPRAVIAVPLYNGERTLERAVASLLEQERTDQAVILVDDCSADATAALAEGLAAQDPRITFLKNERRLGLIGNWQRCFELARTIHPDAEYFAWASDHDWWAPGWLGSMIDALESSPDAVLAFPRPYGVDDEGAEVRAVEGLDTRGVAEPGRRLHAMSHTVGAGYMVYGLFRSRALERAGPFPLTLLPDRLLLLRLSLLGTFVRVEEMLWQRHKAKRPKLGDHQRATLFSATAPRQARLPAWSVHGAILFVELGVRGAGLPKVGRMQGMGHSLRHLVEHAGLHARKRLRTVSKRRRREARRVIRRGARRGRKALRRGARRGRARLLAIARRGEGDRR